MADKQGYIKLFRKIVDWEWYTEVNTFKLFLHMLIMANHDNQKWRGEVIERGTFITSYGSLSNETGLTIREVRTALKHLLSTGDIEVKATSQNTRIYIIKYDFYQKSDMNSDKGKNGKISDELKPIEQSNNFDDTDNDNQTTSERQSNDKQSDNQTTTNKNVKNEKNEKNVKNKDLKDIVGSYSQNPALIAAINDFVDMRKAMKGFTTRALELGLKNLDKLAANDEMKIDIVNQSIEKSWKGFFLIKNNQQQKGSSNPYKEIAEKMEEGEELGF